MPVKTVAILTILDVEPDNAATSAAYVVGVTVVTVPPSKMQSMVVRKGQLELSMIAPVVPPFNVAYPTSWLTEGIY